MHLTQLGTLRSKGLRFTGISLVLVCSSFFASAFPVYAASWTAASGVSAGRYDATLTLMPNGAPLIAGGNNNNPVSWSSYYGPAANAWYSTANNMHNARYLHTANVVTAKDGTPRVLVAGGYDLNGATNTAELYNPATFFWGPTAQTMNHARAHAASALLSDGRAVIVGGDSAGTAEVYDPKADTFTLVADPLPQPWANLTATTLSDGRVLVAGGVTTGGIPTHHAYLLDVNAQPGTQWAQVGDLSSDHNDARATLLQDGRVLLTGGLQSNVAEVFNPTSNSWSASTMNAIHYLHTATLLPDGKVLVAGGTAGTSHATATCELYDPIANTWTVTASMSAAREEHAAVLVTEADGSKKVFVVAGENDTGYLSSAELFSEN